MKYYLEQLIYALNDSDIQKLKDISFKKSRIKDYLHELIETRDAGIPDKNYFLKKLKINEGGYRKMRTILLDQCLNKLVPEGGVDLINFLGRYRLSELFIRETEELRKKLINEKIPDEVKSEFYWACFKGYIRLPYTSFDIFELSKISSGYLVSYHKPDKVIFDCIIQLNEIFIQIIQSFFSLNINEARYNMFQKQIQNIEVFLSSVKSNRLSVFAKGVRLILEFYFKPATIELQSEIDQLVIEYSELNDEGKQDEFIAAKFYQAYNQFKLQNYSVSMELFHAIEKDFSNQLSEHPHIVYRYAQVLLMNDKLEECKRMLDKYMKKYLKTFDQDSYVLTCLIYSSFHLLNNEDKMAMDYIRNCLSIIDKKTYLQKELLARIYEIIYFLHQYDFKFSEYLLTKFLRYLRNKSDINKSGYIVLQIVAFQKTLKKLFRNKTNLSDFENDINNIFKGQGDLTGKLIIHAANRNSKKIISERFD